MCFRLIHGRHDVHSHPEAAVLTVVIQQVFKPLGFPTASWTFAFRTSTSRGKWQTKCRPSQKRHLEPAAPVMSGKARP